MSPILSEDHRATLIFRLLFVAGARLRTLMDRRLADTGLTTQQAAVLTIIEMAPRPPQQGEVARVLGTSHQNVRQLLDALARKGFVEELIDEEDGRACRFVTTAAVRRRFASRDAADAQAVRRWLRGLEAKELGTFLEALQRLVAGLPAPEDEAPRRRTKRARRR